jgi:hypothetical protein
MFGDLLGSTNSYLLTGLIFLAFGLIIFILRKDLRVQITVMSLLFIIISVLIDPIYKSNYNISNNTSIDFSINPETVILMTGIGAFASVIYNFIFAGSYARKIDKFTDLKFNFKKLLYPIGIIILFAILTILTPLTTLQAYLLSATIYMVGLFFIRKDLLRDSLYSGSLVLISMILIINSFNIIQPGWYYRSTSYFSSPVQILSMTIDSIMFFFFIGVFVGTIFELWQEIKEPQDLI